ncbi:MAG TPA: chorismate-binding protein [Pyrinomonadaceae bacterium]|nr:chorismate-binding protein [Pyrinomonadaceae bacterium]
MSKLQPATFEEFERDAARGNVVAVARIVPENSRSPVQAFTNLAGSARHAFLLESVEGGEGVAKYSFIGADPYMIVRGRGKQTFVERNGSSETLSETVAHYLQRHFREHRLGNRTDLAPFAGGAVGYLGYRAAHWFEPALNKHPEGKTASQSDEALLMFYRSLVVFDRAQQQIHIVSVVFTDESEASGLRELYDQAVRETERLEKLLGGDSVVGNPQPAGEHLSEQSTSAANLSPAAKLSNSSERPAISSNWTREGFEEAVHFVKESILAGDCYQTVISQRFKKQVSADPFSIYRALRQSNPSPYMYFLKLGDESIIGASPEMLVRCRGEQIDYRPIAGTRRRGETAAEDDQLAEEMRGDEKEVAEHMMLVDLGRNDLGRVAEYGSVRVEELMSVERYSKVQHLVSSLRARLRNDCDRFDALAACFPAGTVTGAPKVKAMEIIGNLEPEERGVYAGAVLYADYADNLDSCIAIRTIVLREGEASVQAGAGIVADSIPEREYEETVHKAGALFRAIEIAEEANDSRDNTKSHELIREYPR